jgi:2-polyprenyl-3-methyl-5-hydroxy-6-metoxy-1,4-benzoquinol methylase
MASEKVSCILCEKPAYLKYRGHDGYQFGKKYDIYHCAHCVTAFASPHEVDQGIYNLIYSQIQDVMGYNRYYNYSNQILKEKDPMGYLAKSEDVYWSIWKYLMDRNKKDLKILEVGCGFGYLTYALHRAGYDVLGIDISRVAIDEAAKRYGKLYQCVDIHDFARQVGMQYDLIISTEVIEHVQDVKGFLSAANQLLVPGGDLIMTTPDSTPYPEDILWDTEPPPVHLWWFSQSSMRHLAKYLGHQAEFMNLTEFTLQEIERNKSYFKPYTEIRNFQPSRLPRFSEKGEPLTEILVKPPQPQIAQIPVKDIVKKFLSCLKLIGMVRMVKKALSHLRKMLNLRGLIRQVKNNPYHRMTMCVIFHKPASQT